MIYILILIVVTTIMLVIVTTVTITNDWPSDGIVIMVFNSLFLIFLIVIFFGSSVIEEYAADKVMHDYQRNKIEHVITIQSNDLGVEVNRDTTYKYKQ